jgi:vacuolar-type H+-ATPase subunit C/Vma6
MFDFFRHEYAAARLRAMKGRLIKKQNFVKMADSRSFPELISLLEGTEYDEIFYHDLKKNVIEIENGLDKHFVNVLRKVRNFYPERDKVMVDVFLNEWEMKNMGLLIKSVLTGENLKDFVIPTDGFDWKGLKDSENLGELATKIRGSAYEKVIEKGQGKVEQFGIPVIDFYLEEAYVKKCLKLIGYVNGKEMFLSYFKMRNDLVNMRNVLRGIMLKKDFSNFLLKPSHVSKEWFKISSPDSLLERAKKDAGLKMKGLARMEDDLLFELALGENLESLVSKFLFTTPFGAGLLLYYIVTKRSEVNSIKAITKFVKEDLDRKDLKTLLRV